MQARRLAITIGASISALAAILILTTAPVIPEQRTKHGSATAVAVVDPNGVGAEGDCIDIEFTIEIGYTAKVPVLNLFGFGLAQDITADHGTLSVAARPTCVESVDSVEAIVYLYLPACGGDPCDVMALDYRAGQGDNSTSSTMNFEGPRGLPASDIARNEWCLEVWADAAYSKTLGGGASTSARVTDSDLCLDLS